MSIVKDCERGPFTICILRGLDPWAKPVILMSNMNNFSFDPNFLMKMNDFNDDDESMKEFSLEVDENELLVNFSLMY